MVHSPSLLMSFPAPSRSCFHSFPSAVSTSRRWRWPRSRTSSSLLIARTASIICHRRASSWWLRQHCWISRRPACYPAARNPKKSSNSWEQRDLLFAKLLQYRAYKRASQRFMRTMASQARAYPRDVPLDPEFVGLIPRFSAESGAQELALLAFQAFSRDQSEPTVSLEHLHHPRVSVSARSRMFVRFSVSEDPQRFRSSARMPSTGKRWFLGLWHPRNYSSRRDSRRTVGCLGNLNYRFGGDIMRSNT